MNKSIGPRAPACPWLCAASTGASERRGLFSTINRIPLLSGIRGWIQIYCRNNQEIIDTLIQAYRIAEAVYVPVMVCYDGFILSHTMMPVDIPDAALVKEFLPPYRPHTFLSQDDPRTINPVLFPNRRENAAGILCDGYMEMRYKLQSALEGAKTTIVNTNNLYAETFGRDHGGMLWEYMTGGCGNRDGPAWAPSPMKRRWLQICSAQKASRPVSSGFVSTGRSLRRTCGRPFKKPKVIHLFEKAISYGYEGALCSDLKAAFYGSDVKAPIYRYIVGLGGRDVQPAELTEAVKSKMNATPDVKSQDPIAWLNCRTE